MYFEFKRLISNYNIRTLAGGRKEGSLELDLSGQIHLYPQ